MSTWQGLNRAAYDASLSDWHEAAALLNRDGTVAAAPAADSGYDEPSPETGVAEDEQMEAATTSQPRVTPRDPSCDPWRPRVTPCDPSCDLV
eukprot:11286-Prymnesium_polylepis.1